ncbi:MAG: c-type cytochrome biogenesis protein CcmI [Alphaproteobacteria bacterium]|nr:c-type cytochrome biogenesis protein CcmI [Alphaproteobacteria bacterium]
MTWLLFSIFFVIALGIVLVPLFRYRDKPGQRRTSDQNIEVYKAQLQELDTDQKNDLLSEHEAVSARFEIERRLLNVAADDEAAPPPSPNAVSSRAMLTMVMTVVLLLSAGLYLKIGHPGMPDYPLASRENSLPRQIEEFKPTKEMATRLATLQASLKKNPKDVKAWRLLGQYQTELHQRAAAAKAFQHWYELDPDNVNAAVVYGESLIILSEGRVGPAALLILDRARRDHPNNPGVRHYLALAQYQAGNIRQALASWKALEADSRPGAPWLGAVQDWIRQSQKDLGLPVTEPKPVAPALSSRERDVIAKMTPKQQKAIIRRMVGRLADRVGKTPKKIEGWFRLAKAYMILGEKDNAIKSMKQALKYAPDNMKPMIKKQLEMLTKPK